MSGGVATFLATWRRGRVRSGQRARECAVYRGPMAEGREELRGFVRGDEPVPSAKRLVLRGGPDTASLIRSHARRLNRSYELDGAEVWGVSVFAALDDIGPASFDELLRSRLRGYPTVYLPTVETLTTAGLALLATFRRPHYTVLLPDIDAADRLLAALGELHLNPYAVD